MKAARPMIPVSSQLPREFFFEVSASIPLLIGMPLWLESYAAAMLASVLIGMLVLRILVEEQFLRRELKGYDAYTKRVRYRLIPLLW